MLVETACLVGRKERIWQRTASGKLLIQSIDGAITPQNAWFQHNNKTPQLKAMRLHVNV